VVDEQVCSFRTYRRINQFQCYKNIQNFNNHCSIYAYTLKYEHGTYSTLYDAISVGNIASVVEDKQVTRDSDKTSTSYKGNNVVMIIC
jgi:hypothetical protein